MSRQFNQFTEVDSKNIHDMVGTAMKATGIGMGLGLLGILLVCTAIFGFRFAPPWLRSALQIGAVFWLPAFPIGTVLALVLLIILWRNPQAYVQSNTV